MAGRQAIMPASIERFEFTPVYTAPDAPVDIIFLHGLNGAPAKTWRANASNSDGTEGGIFWPRDLLPQSLEGSANVLVYGYNADVVSSAKNPGGPSQSYMFNHAQNLVTLLTMYRKRPGKGGKTRPILWVVHSLGGILLKAALNHSASIKDPNLEDQRGVYVSTYGIIFLGTPHIGSDLADWGLLVQRIVDAVFPKKLINTEGVLLKTLKKESETLLNINNQFLQIQQRFKIHLAYETQKTDLKGTKAMVVEQPGASNPLPGATCYGIEATHSAMCKFDRPTAPGYLAVSTDLREWALNAPPFIQRRWEVEREERREYIRLQVSERMASYPGQENQPPVYESPQLGHRVPGLVSREVSDLSTAPPDLSGSGHLAALPPSLATSQISIERQPLFIHPQHFRPNSYFVGRQEELGQLHRLLMDQRRRSQGTSAVLVAGMAGSGKTHLARQYVFDHQPHYPGGVYWVRSTTIQDMESGFWQIAKNEAIRDMTGQQRVKDLTNPDKMVELVCNWFNSFDGWLLIFDGIRLERPNAVSKFIPDRKNTSILFTSRERSVAGSHFYDNPSVMELDLLSAQDAQSLLLEELGKTKPYSLDDLRKALELVQLVDRLPLMIHAAAQQMKATREPLQKYLRGFKDQSKIGMLPAYQSIREELQARGNVEALNLMYILCFFSQHVPVELLALGLGALDQRTPVRSVTADHKKSLNKTFVTLIAFALIERNEMEDLPPASSSSKSNQSFDSPDKDVNPLDILRIHTIVQSFFIELLASEKQLMFWLERAISVFCESYDRATSKMETDSTLGLPDDYRRYSIHGERLVKHFEPLKRQTPPLIEAMARLNNILEGIPDKIASLQRATSANIVGQDGRSNIPHVSIFERSNSLSTQSTAPGLSNSSSFLGDETTQFESPIASQHPHPFLPYPRGESGLETPGLLEHLAPGHFPDQFPDDRTVTPTPSQRVEQDQEPEWTVVSAHRPARHTGQRREWVSDPHRSTQKQGQRRYHDHAGAWRNSNDPRVSVTKEFASGEISSPVSSPGGGLGRHSPFAKDAMGGLIHADQPTESIPISGRPTYASAVSGPKIPVGADSNRSSPTLVAPSTTGSSPRSYFAGIAGMLGRLTHRRTSDTSSRPSSLHQEWADSQVVESRHDEEMENLEDPASLRASDARPARRSGTRSSHSSPGLQQGPFQPPPHRQLLSSSTGSLHHTPWQPPRQGASAWEDEDGEAARPLFLAATPLIPPSGYTSQPMSRNPSSRPVPISVGGPPLAAGGSRSRSRGGSSSRRSQSRASVVQTEPSPRIPTFDIEQTSYQERSQRGRPRGASLFGGSNVPNADERQTSQARMLHFGNTVDSPDPVGYSRRSSPRGSPHAIAAEFAGGERRARRGSGSGGIRIGNREIIEFGDVPLDNAAGARRHRQQESRDSSTRRQAPIREDSTGEVNIGLGIQFNP